MRDDFDSVIADRFTVLDDVPVPDTWSRVQSRVLDRPLPDDEEAAIVIDLEVPHATQEHRRGSTLVKLGGLVAAVAAVVVVFVAIRNDDPESPAARPPASANLPATETPGSTAPQPEAIGPLAAIRSRLVESANVEVFRMRSDTPSYWRLTTLPEFDGQQFRLPQTRLSPVDNIDGGVPDGRAIRQEIEILALTGRLVPAVADVSQASPSENLMLADDTGTLVASTDLVAGDRYTIVSRAPVATPDELRAATTVDPPDEIVLGLPGSVPDIVFDTAIEVTAGAATDYDRLILLQNWFRTDFAYSLEVQGGHGYDAIEDFLQTREGFSEQFAATFAVMARTLGMPSRAAVGYTPGQLRSDGWYSVLDDNSHAWPEIWFDGIGWVAFEPTPSDDFPGAEGDADVPPIDGQSLPDPTGLRALTEIEEGDVLIPTYIPDGMQIENASSEDNGETWRFEFEVVAVDGSAGISAGFGREAEEKPGPDGETEDDVRFDIDGQVWSTWIDTGAVTFFEYYRFHVDASGDVDEQTLETFAAGLRAGPPEDFPAVRSHTGLHGELLVVDGTASTEGEVVAEDDQLQFVLATNSEQMCWWVRDHSPEPGNWIEPASCQPVSNFPTETALIHANDYTPGVGVLSFVGWTDDESARQVRVTSPLGDEFVLSTQGPTQMINGQFFIGHIDWRGSYNLAEFDIETIPPGE